MLKVFLMLTLVLAGAGILPFATTAEDARGACDATAQASAEMPPDAEKTDCRGECGCGVAECAASPFGDVQRTLRVTSPVLRFSSRR